jgi:hypothetical protein
MVGTQTNVYALPPPPKALLKFSRLNPVTAGGISGTSGIFQVAIIYFPYLNDTPPKGGVSSNIL